MGIEGHIWAILGGSWDLVTTFSWPCNPTHSLPKWPYIDYPSYRSASTASSKILCPMSRQLPSILLVSQKDMDLVQGR